MATNYELLVAAGLINSATPPSSADVTTINALNQADVNGLINVFKNVTSPFLVRTCNPEGTVGVGQDGRTIGIVF